MEIIKESSGAALTIKLCTWSGYATAPALEAELKSCLEGVEKLTLDLQDLEYISSAGLRVLLSAQKAMNGQGSMAVPREPDRDGNF